MSVQSRPTAWGFFVTPRSISARRKTATSRARSAVGSSTSGHIAAAYGCSLGGSFVGLLAARQNIKLDYGILGSSDLDQASKLTAKLQTELFLPLIYPFVRSGSCKIYNLDFPEVIKVRNELLPAGEREKNVPCDLNDTAWFERIDASGGAVFFAAGVFYYFLKEQVRSLVCKMADAFPGGVLVFDAANKKAVKLMLKTWIKDAQIKDVGAYFAVADAKAELSPWDERLSVSSRGYMLGYNDLTAPSVSGFFRFLPRVGDNSMNMQIVKLKFGK